MSETAAPVAPKAATSIAPAANTTNAKPATAPAANAKPAKAKKVVDPAKAAKRAAFLKKRADKLSEIKAKSPVKFNAAISYKEARDLKVIPSDATSWKAFCELKADAMSKLWLERAAKPALGEKALARKKARLGKLKEMIAKLEQETLN